jgi:hypothetical protein
MSAFTASQAFAEHENQYYNEVMRDTWGHLHAKPKTVHKGTILFTQAENGTYIVIRSDFPTMDGGPWEYEAMDDYVADRAREAGVVYRFEGECRISLKGNYRFVGKAKKVL